MDGASNSSNLSSSPSVSYNRDNTVRTYRNKDIELIQRAGIPYNIHQIVNSTQAEFEELTLSPILTEEQITICSEIRRRGKNKVAAQNSRQRKVDQYNQLETKVRKAKDKFNELENIEKKLILEKMEKSDELNKLNDDYLRKNNRDPEHYAVVQIGDMILIEPKMFGKEPVGSLRPETLLSLE